MSSKVKIYSKAINRFIYWLGRTKLFRAERAEARAYIRELYIDGFSPEEILFLAGGHDSHWKESTIKKYCRGLEVKDTKTKNRALELLVEYIQVNGDWDELSDYVEDKKSLNSFLNILIVLLNILLFN